MLTTAICILGICVSVYLAYTCEEIKNKKSKILLGILTGALFISSCVAFILTAGNTGNEEPVKEYIGIVYFLTALVLISLRLKKIILVDCKSKAIKMWITFQKPSLCKGGWHAERDGRIVNG